MITPTSGKFRNGVREIQNVSDTVDSSFYRLHPSKTDSETLFDDFYSPRLDRKGIKAGTAIYDPNGHVAVVYKVGNDGRIYFVDAHPHSPLTVGSYGEKFVRSRPSAGAGFRNWRPIKLVGAKADSEGNLLGGKVVGMSNKELEKREAYSTCQYYGCKEGVSLEDKSNPTKSDSSWSRGKFTWKGNKVDYYDYLRYALSLGDLKFEPVDEVQAMMTGLCQDLQDRETAVQGAIAKGIDKKDHPSKLPGNIYGTSGEWEDFSTPSRDARLKTSFRELRKRVQEFVEKKKAGSSSIVYEGTDLRGDLLKAYTDAADACSIAYINSAGNKKTLGFDAVRERLFDLSFDPYHCVELRWGAKGDELSSCSSAADGEVKRKWYDAEVYLRNQIERRYDAKMDYDPSGLLGLPDHVGEKNPPDVDVEGYLKSL